MDFKLVTLLFSFVGGTFVKDGRDIRVLSLVVGPIESYYLCVWKDTYMAFCAPVFDVANEFQPTKN